MPVLRQLLVVLVLGAIAAAGYTFQAGIWPASGPTDAAVKGAKSKGGGRKSRGDRASPVLVAQIETKTFRQTVEAVGSTRALQSVNIVSSSSGRITALSIEPGRVVKTGAVLAKLDDEIQQADLAEAISKLEEANIALKRAEKLYRQRNIAEARVIELRAKQAIAKAERIRAKRRLSDRIVRAPFSGRTGMREIDIGARVDTDVMLTTLDDVSSIEIETRLPESLYPIIRKGSSVKAESAAFPNRTFKGTVVAIDKRIDPVGRAFKVHVRVPNKDGALPVGMFMRLTVQLDERQSPAIPEEALVVEGDRKFIYVVDANGEAVTRKPVETGQRRDGVIEIRSGAKSGDRVVSEGTHRLKDGARIKIQPSDLNSKSVTPTPTAELPRKSRGGADKKDGS